MKIYILLIASLIFTSCRTHKGALFFDSKKNLPMRYVEWDNDFSFNIYLNSKLYWNPNKKQKLISNYPEKNFKHRSMLCLVTNDVNVSVYFDVLSDKKLSKKENYAGKKLTVQDVVFYNSNITEKEVEYIILDTYHKLNESDILRISFVTSSKKDAGKLYPYLEEYAIPVVKSLVVKMVEKENNKIKDNIQEYMFDKYESNGNYFQALNFIDRATDSIKIKLSESISFYKSFVGDYSCTKSQNRPIGKSDTIYFVSAKTHLKKIASNFDFILFNENHSDPYCRYFLMQILPDLVRQGYTKIGIETLTDIDHDVNKFGFPIHGSGFYSDEPNMANLIREAVKLGLYVFPFEAYSYNCDSCKTPSEKRNFRERGQANNIISQNKSKNGKTIILSGGSHIYRTSKNPQLKFMAENLKELTSGRILSVNQTFQEKYPVPNEIEDVIPMQKGGEYFLINQLQDKVDLQIVHNSSSHHDKCNNYQTLIGKDCKVEVKLKAIEAGYLAIYDKKEKELFPYKSIPLIVVPFEKRKKFVEISVNNGNYVALEFNHSGFPIHITKIECE